MCDSLGDSLSSDSIDRTAAHYLKDESVIQKIPTSGRTGGFMLSAVSKKNERQTVGSKVMKATGKSSSRITPNCHDQ